jgi:hypothetical protein
MHLDFEILGKDTHAFGISNTACVREHFSWGPSPLCQPSSEKKNFLSPIVLEDPLRLPPLLQ